MKLVGNEELKQLMDQIKYEAPLPHILLYGPSGTGKSTIAKWIAQQTDQEYAIYYASNLDEMFIRYILQNISPNTIIIIDEIHTLSKKQMEGLYQPMEEYVLDGNPLVPFTLIGCTTDLYKIPEPLFRRFIISQRIELYSKEEISEFIQDYAIKPIDEDCIPKIAKLCKGNPGYARNYMEILHKISNGKIGEENVQGLMQLKKIDEEGLDKQDWLYLLSLRKYGTVGLDTLSSLIGEPKQTIEQKIEPYLIQKNFVLKTGKGRVLTPQGANYIREKE